MDAMDGWMDELLFISSGMLAFIDAYSPGSSLYVGVGLYALREEEEPSTLSGWRRGLPNQNPLDLYLLKYSHESQALPKL